MLYDDEENETASQIIENIEDCHNFARLMEVYDDGEDDQQKKMIRKMMRKGLADEQDDKKILRRGLEDGKDDKPDEKERNGG